MGQDEQTLGGIELFENLPALDLKALAKRCRWRRYTADQQIVGHLDETGDVFFIVEGSVRAIIYSLAGKRLHSATSAPEACSASFRRSMVNHARRTSLR